MLEMRLPYLKNKHFYHLLIVFIISRLIFASVLPLGVDEAYQVTIGREFDWSYYDHPPLSFWLPRFFANFFGLESILIYRLPSVIFGSISLYALYGIGMQICGEDTAFWSALLYCISPFFFFSGGVFVLPDVILNASVCMTLLLFLRSQDLKLQETKSSYYLRLVIIGIWLAISFLSKYHSILVPAALLIYFLSTKKRFYWIFQSQIWIVALVGSLGALPVLIWNYQEGWPTFVFHSSRANAEINILNFIKMFVGQLIYLSPPTLLLSIWAFFAVHKTEKVKLLLYPSLFIILGFNFLFFLGANGFPHWTMPGWMLALPLVAVFLKQRGQLFKRKFKILLVVFMVPIWLTICAFTLHVNTGWLTAKIETTPEWDNTLQFMRWDDFGAKFDDFSGSEYSMKVGFLNWVDAASLGVVLSEKYSLTVIGNDPHHFKYRETNLKAGVGYLLVPSLKADEEKRIEKILRDMGEYDPDVEYLHSVDIKRGKNEYATVLIFSMLFP